MRRERVPPERKEVGVGVIYTGLWFYNVKCAEDDAVGAGAAGAQGGVGGLFCCDRTGYDSDDLDRRWRRGCDYSTSLDGLGGLDDFSSDNDNVNHKDDENNENNNNIKQQYRRRRSWASSHGSDGPDDLK